MSNIKVHTNDACSDCVRVPLHHQSYFYYFLSYVLFSDLRSVDSHAVGLFVLDKKLVGI